VRTLLALALIATLQACGTLSGGELEHLNLPGRSDTRPFSHVVVAGDTVYVAGTLGLDPETGQPPADPAEEARLALEGIRAKLQLAELDMGDLVQVQVFCPDTALYETFNTVYATFFDGDYPVRAFIGSGPLLRGCRFEVNGIAAR
jgi:enamine deaminase RidA (YjgF/YER057c/UK114 family)